MDLVGEKTLPGMKVGIVTFSAAYNYGAALQCRCLQEVLSGLGLDAYVVDYRPAYLTEPYKILKPYYCKKPAILFQLPFRFWGARRRDRAFRRFQKAMPRVSCGTGGLDAVFFGSDQIWNPRICKGMDPVFFAGTEAFATTRNVSYAASDGSVKLSPLEAAEYQRFLKNFYRLGVREESLRERLAGWGFSSVVTLDPVLLAGRPVLDGMAVSLRHHSAPYVLTYEAVDYPRVKVLARSFGHKVVSVAREPYSQGRNGYGPGEFVSLFREASAIVTTSFHGVALALLYHKDFYYVETGKASDDRIRNLLTALGLAGRMVPEGGKPAAEEIDYVAVDRTLERLRTVSLNFIKEALQ
jgi:hypothetical protein